MNTTNLTGAATSPASEKTTEQMKSELAAAHSKIAVLTGAPQATTPAPAPPSERELLVRRKMEKGFSREQAIGILERQEAHDRAGHVRPRGPLVTASRHGKITRGTVSRPSDA
jgi:hypothetical protein